MSRCLFRCIHNFFSPETGGAFLGMPWTQIFQKRLLGDRNVEGFLNGFLFWFAHVTLLFTNVDCAT